MSKLEQIRKDPEFQAEISVARSKAQKAADKVHSRISAREEKELERHQKKMAEFRQERDAIFKDVYRPVFDPLEEEAYARAEKRLEGVT